MWAALTVLVAATQTHAQPTSIFLMQRTSGDPDFIPDSSSFKGRGLLPANDPTPVVADSVMVCSTNGDTVYAKDAVTSAGMIPPLTVYLTEGTTLDPPWPNAANGTILYFRIKPTGEGTWYRANVVGAAYTVGNAISGASATYSAQNVVVGGGNGASWDVKISVPNIALQFAAVPADTSGKPMRIVVNATNDNVTDNTFTKQITLTKKSGNGTLSGTLSVTASAGTATFTNVIYKAAVDGESFELTADDAVGGTDYPSVDSGPIVSNVVATKLAFQTQPAGSVSGDTLTTQPVVRAIDDSSSVDTSFTGAVTITHSGAGFIEGTGPVSAIGGVARFHVVRYHATADQQSFTLQASATGLTSSPNSTSVTSDVVASLLYFATEPSSACTSGVVFSVLPVVEARDTALVKDTGFSGTVHLGVAGLGTLGPLAADTIATFASGVASFSGKNTAHFATADGQTFAIVARSGSLTPDTTASITSDVVATKLKFTTDPTSAPNNRALTPQPVVKAVNAQDVVDSQFVRDITVARASGYLNDRGTVGGVTSATPVKGTATFTGVTFSAIRDLDEFLLQATSAGTNPSVTAGLSDTVAVSVTATRIRFAIQPRYAMSGVALGTAPSVAPVIEAIDSAQVRDRDFSGGTVTISKGAGAGSIAGTLTGTMDTSGTVTFLNVAYRATADREGYKLAVSAASFTDTSAADTADIKASKLVFNVSPDSAVSGKPFGVQPVVWAVNDSNQKDLDYNKGIKLQVDFGPGVLSGTDSVTAIAGVATYSGVAYHATADRERYRLAAQGDSTVAGSSRLDTVDVRATRLAFTTQPDSSVSGAKLRQQPRLGFVDSAGVADADVAKAVSVRLASGAGRLLGTLKVTASGGVASFDSILYQALVDRESFALRAVADTTVADSIMSDTSSAVVSDIVATKLAFTSLPDSAINVRYLRRAPVVKAVDADSAVDAQFVSQVTLGKSAATSGSLFGRTQKTAIAGVATFDSVYYKATVDHQVFTLKATTTASGIDSALAPVDTIEVRATRVNWATQPAGAVSNIDFTTQPRLAAQDTGSVTDRDFVDSMSVVLRTNLGSLLGTAKVKADTGLAVFSGLRFKATADSQAFSLRGSATGLDTTAWVSLTADVLATRGIIKSMPTLTYNGQPWSAPVVAWAVDADSLKDRNYNRSIKLGLVAVQGVVEWAGGKQTVAAVNGVATFTGDTTAVAGDRDSYKFVAYNDTVLTTQTLAPSSDSTAVGRILPAPQLIALSSSPTAQEPNQLPNLSWTNVGTAVSYELDFGTTGSSCESIANDLAVPRADGAVSFFQQGTRIPDGSYCWRVRTVNSDGEKSAYSANSNFTTIPTVGQWGVMFLVACMLATGAWHLRRRSAA
jgi:hypothetical protein